MINSELLHAIMYFPIIYSTTDTAEKYVRFQFFQTRGPIANKWLKP